MRVILLLHGIFISELVKYWFGLKRVFNLKPQRFNIIIIGYLVFCILVLAEIINLNTPFIMNFIIIIPILLISFSHIATIFKAFFLISCIDEIIGIVTDLIYKYFLHIDINDHLSYIINNVVMLIILIILPRIIRKNSRNIAKKIKRFLNVGIYIAIIFMGISLIFTIAGLNYASTLINNNKFIVYSNIMSIISLISVGFFGFIIMYIEANNKKIKKYLEMEIILSKTQKNYYEAMLAKEEDTRRFRHDINNHLMCIKELAKKEYFSEVVDYIERINSQQIEIQKRVYCTGNEVMDLILNYYLNQLNKDVKITILGKCIYNIDINNMELCIIFSNLIQNSVEELNRQNVESKYFKLGIHCGRDFVKIEILNSASFKEYSLHNELPKTNKSDYKNHGIGLNNAKETVEKNGGTFEIATSTNQFKVKIILPVC